MKKVILLFCLLPYLASGQVIDNFESGLLNNWVQSSPNRWSADSSGALSGKFSLHQTFDNPEAGTDRIGIPVANIHPDEGVTTWSFIIKHGYDPSSSNNWSVFLFSDTGPSAMSSDGSTNGYAIGVNLTGYDDTLRLWKIKGTIVTTVVNCCVNWQTNIGTINPVKIKVERYTDGQWIITIFRLNGTIIKTTSGSDPELFEASWFGINYKYSSTRDRLLWIDDINIQGTFYEDISPPSVTGYMIMGRKTISLTLSEEPVSQFTNIENFFLNSEVNRPLSIMKKSDLAFELEFGNEFINKSLNQLIIRDICDDDGNCISDTVIGFTPAWAETGDIVISEIMADPLPSVSLPAKEYLELTNRSSFSFNLKDWKLISGDQSITLPSFVIGPDEIRIMCSAQDTALFREYGSVTGLSQFPALSDYGKLIYVIDSSGMLIHGVEYTDDWYGNELKSRGGWSLEMIDTSFPFYYEGNWTVSVSRKGGTPGVTNSVSRINKDLSFPGIQNVFADEKSMISVRYSEPLADFSKIKGSDIEGGPVIKDVSLIDPLFREFRIQLSSELKAAYKYKIQFPEEMRDFAGNKMERSSFEFGLSETPMPGDILFNEILFNPLPGDPDYIELYNCSGKIINASRLHLVYVNESTSDTSVMVPVSSENRCILPAAYYAVTSDRQKIIERYISSVPENLFRISAMPSMPDANGTLILFNSELDVIDKVLYSEKMHYSLLSGSEGIALEKTGKCNSSAEAVNWHSATEISGWGTPGGPNSVSNESFSQKEKVMLSSTRITPDSDGYEDFLSINLAPGGKSNVVTVSVFDETGIFIRKIASNILSGAEATFIWDGTADDGTPVNTGIYIVLISLFDEQGKTERWKKICTVLR